MKHVISYKDGASLLEINKDWQDKITQGNGTSYGSEWMLQKKKGKTTGWIGYTLSWNYRQFNDLNLGNKYPYKYDRRHDIEVLVSHIFNKRISISGTWQYGTGNAVSLPTASYRLPAYGSPIDLASVQNPVYFPDYEIVEGKNDYRMPPYHRMDINIEFTKQKRTHSRTWSFGAYNVYNRANPLYLATGSKVTLVDGKYEFKKVIGNIASFRSYHILCIVLNFKIHENHHISWFNRPYPFRFLQ
jgi:hypothetical protein